MTKLEINRQYHRAYWQRVRKPNNLARGLTANGFPRTRRFLTDAENREMHRRVMQELRDRRAAAGLNSRGKPYKILRPKDKFSRQERAYREFRAGLNVHRPEVLHYLDRNGVEELT